MVGQQALPVEIRMKYYSIAFPGEFGQQVEEIWSEKQILKSYFTYWSEQMKRIGKEHCINESDCIEDWCVVHWAIEVNKPDWITE